MASRLIEYLYLAAAVTLAVMFTLRYKEAGVAKQIPLLVGAFLASAMYAYRRGIRKRLEKKD